MVFVILKGLCSKRLICRILTQPFFHPKSSSPKVSDPLSRKHINQNDWLISLFCLLYIRKVIVFRYIYIQQNKKKCYVSYLCLLFVSCWLLIDVKFYRNISSAQNQIIFEMFWSPMNRIYFHPFETTKRKKLIIYYFATLVIQLDAIQLYTLQH